MKKFLFIMMSVLFTVVLFSCKKYDVEIKVFMPTEYISEDLIDAFEEEFQVGVNIITFDSNETAIPFIESNSYDVVIPSDYAIEELVSKGLIEDLDWSKVVDFDLENDLDSGLSSILENLKNDTSLASQDRGGFDLLRYGAPYFWGNFGIVYDTQAPSSEGYADISAEIEDLGWDVLATSSSDRRIGLYDSARDMLMASLKREFFNSGSESSVNAPQEAEIEAAFDWLREISDDDTNTRWITDELLYDMLLSTPAYDIGVTYSGDAIYLMSENDRIGYYVPQEGTNVFVDAMCIPKNATHVEEAYQFISYFLREDVQYTNSEEWGYTSVRGDVVDTIIADEVYPESSYRIVVGSRDEIFRYNPTLKQYIDENWLSITA